MSDTSASRGIGLWGAVAIGVGGMVGGGIFAVLGVVASKAGGAAPLAFAVAGAVALLTATSYARLSVAHPSKGGTVVFVDRVFGVDLFTGSLNNLLWCSYLVTLSLYAAAFANYGAALVGASDPPTWLFHLLVTAAIVVPTMLNLLSAEIVARTETAVVVIKLAILAVVAVAGATSIERARLAIDTWPGLPAVVAAGMLVFVAYEGFELIANSAEDVRQPETTLPRAFFVCVGFVALLYVVIAAVTVGTLSPGRIADAADFALSAAAEPSLGRVGFYLVAVSAVLATFSALNATLYGAARLSWSIADEGELPPALERRVWNQPVGLLATAAAALVLANTLDLTDISSIASAGFLIVFGVVNAAGWAAAPETGQSRVTAGAGILGCAGALVVLVVDTASDRPAALAVLGLLLAVSAGSEAVWLRHRRHLHTSRHSA